MSTTTNSTPPPIQNRTRRVRAWAAVAAVTLAPVAYLVIETAGVQHP
jgi:hypothetical protein